MSQEAVLLYDRDGFLERILAKVGEELERRGAERKFMGNFWFWDLSGASGSSDSSRSSTTDEVAEP